MSSTVLVAVALLQHGHDSQGQPLYVVTKRLKEAHLGGVWELPGGKVEAEELAESAVVRELREELGVEVANVRPMTFSHYAYPMKTVLLLFFEAHTSLNSPEPRPLASDALRLMTADELLNLPMPPANEPLRRLLQTRT